MLHIYYIYVDMLHYDVTVSNKIYSYMDCHFSLHTFQIILNISSICYTFNNKMHNSYLLKFILVGICIMIYHHEHNIDHKFIRMLFIDIIDDVQSLLGAKNAGDVKGT